MSPTTQNENLENLDGFVQKAKPGESYCYHKGLLMFDRQLDQKLEVVCAEALKMSDRGLIMLLQRRVGKFNCEYLAIRTSKIISDDVGTMKPANKLAA